jgi:hypothetical protein
MTMKINCHSAYLDAKFEANLEIEEGAKYSIRMNFEGKEFVEIGDDLIEALRKLRLNSLEPLGIVPLLNGCRRDFVGSRMQRQSTGGKIGYLFVLGEASKPENTVLTFDCAPVEMVVSVEEQDRHFKYWLESLRK